MELRSFQVKNRDFLVKRKRCGLVDEMGLGKTRSALAALEMTGVLKGGARILILCGKTATYVWRDEIEEHLPEALPAVYIVKGQPHQRNKIWGTPVKSDDAIFITTYAAAMRHWKFLCSIDWDIVIVDEYHRRCINRKSKTCLFLKSLKTVYFWAVTGIPAKKGPQSMWAMLNVLNRHRFSSYWRFVNTFCFVEKNYWGTEIIGPKNVPQLTETISPYFIRHYKKDVMPDLPPKTRQMIKIEMAPEQRRIVDDLTKDMIARTTGDDLVVASTVLTKILRMRQILVCPKILDANLGIGTAIETTGEMIEELPDSHCMVFTPFTAAMPYIEAHLKKVLADPPVFVHLRGGLEPEELARLVKLVKAERGIAICSVQYAESFSIETASYGFFPGCDWDPFANYQAEDRMHRMATKNAVNLYYMRYIDSVTDDSMEEILDGKVMSVNKFLRDLRAHKIP